MSSIILGPLVTIFFYFSALYSVANDFKKTAMPILIILSLLAGEFAVCTNIIARKIDVLIDFLRENKGP